MTLSEMRCTGASAQAEAPVGGPSSYPHPFVPSRGRVAVVDGVSRTRIEVPSPRAAIPRYAVSIRPLGYSTATRDEREGRTRPAWRGLMADSTDTREDAPAKPFRLGFRRHGLGWKLVSFKLPAAGQVPTAAPSSGAAPQNGSPDAGRRSPAGATVEI